MPPHPLPSPPTPLVSPTHARGASRRAAATAAWALTGGASPGASDMAALPRHTAACHGQAVCGDFGTDTVQCFLTVGGVGPLTTVVERLATQRGADAFVDARVNEDCMAVLHCRLQEEIIYRKRGTEQPLAIWGVQSAVQDLQPGVLEPVHTQKQGWLYEVTDQCNASNPWKTYQ
eukprot:gene17455-23534_t